LRNKLSWIFFDLLSSLILNTGRAILKQNGFKAVKNIEDSFSSIAQIIPMPAQFDWPILFRDAKRVHYIGSLVDNHNSGGSFDLPPNNMKPVVYVSLGTLQNENYKLLKRIDSALASMNVFPIIALGKWVPASGKIPFTLNATVLDYAPQKQILAKSSLCITHGGMNTALESLTFGVPLIVIPITNDQPGVAQRVVSTGVGLSIDIQNATIIKIQSAVQNILESESIKNAALQMKVAIAEAGGCERAVDIIEKAIGRF
jgi:MGT family glycosyltransferase